MKKIRKTYKHDQANINEHFLYEANKGSILTTIVRVRVREKKQTKQ